MCQPADPSRRVFTATLRQLCCGLFACGLLVAGCKQAETESAPPLDPAVVLNTPADAARSLLHFLQADLQAAARHDRAAAGRARDQLVWHIAARDEIIARHRKAFGARARNENEVLRDCTGSWASVIAYYTAGLELDRLQVVPAAEDARRAVVRVPAHGREDQAVIRVNCLQGSDGLWRVQTVDLTGPEGAVSPSVTTRAMPSSLPAPATSPGHGNP